MAQALGGGPSRQRLGLWWYTCEGDISSPAKFFLSIYLSVCSFVCLSACLSLYLLTTYLPLPHTVFSLVAIQSFAQQPNDNSTSDMQGTPMGSGGSWIKLKVPSVASGTATGISPVLSCNHKSGHFKSSNKTDLFSLWCHNTMDKGYQPLTFSVLGNYSSTFQNQFVFKTHITLYFWKCSLITHGQSILAQGSSSGHHTCSLYHVSMVQLPTVSHSILFCTEAAPDMPIYGEQIYFSQS